MVEEKLEWTGDQNAVAVGSDLLPAPMDPGRLRTLIQIDLPPAATFYQL